MALIEKRYVDQLLQLGLVISEPFPEGHVLSQGIRIGKPESVKGNCVPNFHENLIGVDLDAPIVMLFEKHGEWCVCVLEHRPEPGPGDFETHWATADEAVQDIINYFFGNPERMNLKAASVEADRARRRT